MLKSLAILFSVVAGVLAGIYSGSQWLAAGIIASGIAMRFVVAACMRRDFSRYGLWTRLHSVWPCLILAGVAMLSAVWHLPYPESFPENIPCRIYATVEDRRTTTMGERYTVGIDNVVSPDGKSADCRNLQGYLFASADVILRPGDRISYSSILKRLDDPTPGRPAYATYDMIRVYEGKNHPISGKPKFHLKRGDLRVVGHSDGLASRCREWRSELSRRIETSSLGMESAALIRALITGEREGMRPDRLQYFRDAGVAHTLAVSGMHVGIVSGLLLWLTLPLNLIRGRRWRYIIAAAGGWGFVLLTGMQYSTIRAALMLTLASMGRITERRVNPFSGVCMAAVIIIILSPYALWDAGFQLSFACVAALCLFMEPLNPISHRYHPVTFRIVETMMATIIATGATWIISARYFSSVPLHFLSANIVILPLLPLFMIAGMIYTGFLLAGLDLEWLAYIIDRAVDMLYSFIGIFSSATIEISPSAEAVILWTAGIAAFAIAVHWNRPEARTLPGALKIPGQTDALRLNYPFLTIAIVMMAASVIFL